ncbi:TetR/AcrR family transcriptional regulator [Nocardia stercoris]|uniref:TetR/AcrR family transcriptional regulator n=1 Tax=Nocardia stercoris TaxID=2483361 RepID=UPI001F2F9BDC|nr:TetR/AcrR family transcriptional regulator [Nocardia stercoris]
MTATGESARSGRHYAGRTPEERAGRRRERLLAAALELYGTQGYRGTSIEQLCAGASISTRSFYEEMGSQENLLIALADSIATEAAVALAALRVDPALPLATRIALAFRAYFEVTCRDKKTARVCFVEVIGVSPAVEQWRARWRARMGEVLLSNTQPAIDSGEVVAGDYRLFIVAVLGAVNSLAQELAMADNPPTIDEICTELAAFISARIAAA